MSSRHEYFDVIVVGAGIAGLSAAVRAAEAGASVCVLTKETVPEECNTRYAQGGIVARGGPEDPELLEKDILAAGCWLNNREAVRIVSREGPEAVEELLLRKARVPFLRNPEGEVDLTREAAHSIRRIWHVKDYTGRSIQESLIAYIRGLPNIHLFTSCMAVDIITNTHHSLDDSQRYAPKRALGVYVYGENTGEVVPFFAPATILAAGGVGNLFLHTSNPPGATGDGVAMAERAGAEVINAEYVQFNPTILFHRDLKGFLISESLRGEGARLMNRKGEYFMDRYHPALKDLAPRDEVSRAIYYEMEQSESTYVLLDTSLLKVDPRDRFPSIYETCLRAGIDMTRDPVPVVPAAHYFCGGVKTDMEGRTTIPGLFAAGETACTGVHGANRLASVSLLEGLVFGLRAGAAAASEPDRPGLPLIQSIPDWVFPGEEEAADPILIYHDLLNIQMTMWDYAGIVRTRKRLARAKADLNYLAHRVDSFYRQARLSRPLLELRNAVDTASLIVRAAEANPKSLGCHYLRGSPV
ncbi:MAG: L-aspartate oxidase [Treponema sp.]|nr:L-aspartate oxidase [Treponema sp.]